LFDNAKDGVFIDGGWAMRQDYRDFTEQTRGRKLVLYGVYAGIDMFDFFEKNHISPLCFCDDDPIKQGGKVLNLEVCSLEEVKKNYGKDVVFLITCNHVDSIKSLLIKKGYKDIYFFPEFLMIKSDSFYDEELISQNSSKIEALADLLEGESLRVLKELLKRRREGKGRENLKEIASYPPYFRTDIFNFTNREVFVDAGAYDGRTTVEFIDVVSGVFEAIHVFEPDKSNLMQCREQLQLLPGKIFVNESALYDRNCNLAFYASGTSDARVTDNGHVIVKAVRLDDYAFDSPPTFVKMDIEGAEMNALRGSVETIAEYKPKLAICIYHKPEDLWEIPLFIKKLVPEYRIHIRHHSNFLTETVCYAV
jgi:FkbM family methyltransferase